MAGDQKELLDSLRDQRLVYAAWVDDRERHVENAERDLLKAQEHFELRMSHLNNAPEDLKALDLRINAARHGRKLELKQHIIDKMAKLRKEYREISGDE